MSLADRSGEAGGMFVSKNVVDSTYGMSGCVDDTCCGGGMTDVWLIAALPHVDMYDGCVWRGIGVVAACGGASLMYR